MFTCSLSWIEILGTRYVHGSVVVMNSDLLPVFGIIKDIVMDSSFSYYFVLEILHTICFSSHQHAHEVSLSTPPLFDLVKPSDLYDHSILSLYTIPHCHSFFVPLKYYLIEKV